MKNHIENVLTSYDAREIKVLTEIQGLTFKPSHNAEFFKQMLERKIDELRSLKCRQWEVKAQLLKTEYKPENHRAGCYNQADFIHLIK